MCNSTINGFFKEYRFLSNFWMSPLTVLGIPYTNSEAAYQAGKTLDIDQRRKLFSNIGPKEAKHAGRRITLRSDWHTAKFEVMELCLRSKFTNPILAGKLINTGDRELIEFNTWGDQIWGKTKDGGTNYLGKLLMIVRDDLNTLIE